MSRLNIHPVYIPAHYVCYPSTGLEQYPEMVLHLIHVFTELCDLHISFHFCRLCLRIGYWWESQKERDHWEDQDVGGWTILKWISER
jgi:hypothetical protein